jgi:hypothetical protein
VIARALIVAGLAGTIGLVGVFRPNLTGYTKPDEAWLEKMTPEVVMGKRFIPSQENPNQSYKMTEATYEQLKPYGIVSRIFEGNGKRFDAVVIAGDNADSFHDQRACFQSQGWNLLTDQEVEVGLPDGRTVQMVQLEIESQISGKATALYAFRGPSGTIYSKFGGMWRDYFLAELSTGKIHGGEFFRFIDLTGSQDKAPLYKFAGEFMAQAMDRLTEGKKERDGG